VIAATGRLERLRVLMADEGLDVVVAAGSEPVNHLCGYWRYFGSPPALVVGRDGRRLLLVQHDEVEGASARSFADDVAPYGARGFGLVPDQLPLLAGAVAAHHDLTGRVGVAGVAGFAELLAASVTGTVVDVGPALHAIRLVKDRDELERINASYELAWVAHEAVREALRPGTSEIELFTAGQGAAQVAAGEPIEFVGDLLSGARAAEVCAPIRVAGPRRVEAGDGVVADLVVGLRGYWGDTAETLVAGRNERLEAVRDQLQSIRDRAARLLVPGATGAAIFEAMRHEIEERFPGGEFPHHGGHGVGLSAFEDPHVIPDDRTPLEQGMVIALEPGVYFPGRFGVRVERLYVVAAGGGVELRDAVRSAA
jgi:Xaa-Pro aminopeptidase